MSPPNYNKILADFKRQADIARNARRQLKLRYAYDIALIDIRNHERLKERYKNRLKNSKDPFYANAYKDTLETERTIIEKYEREKYEKDKTTVKNYLSKYGRPVTNKPENRAKESNEVRRARTDPKTTNF